MSVNIEFRIRKSPVIAWELVQPFIVLKIGKPTDKPPLIAMKIAEAAKAFAAEHGTEVRWNYEGQTQGHYVSPIQF